MLKSILFIAVITLISGIFLGIRVQTYMSNDSVYSEEVIGIHQDGVLFRGTVYRVSDTSLLLDLNTVQVLYITIETHKKEYSDLPIFRDAFDLEMVLVHIIKPQSLRGLILAGDTITMLCANAYDTVSSQNLSKDGSLVLDRCELRSVAIVQ